MKTNNQQPHDSREIDISKTTTEEFGYSDIDKKVPLDDSKTSVKIWRVNLPIPSLHYTIPSRKGDNLFLSFSLVPNIKLSLN